MGIMVPGDSDQWHLKCLFSSFFRLTTKKEHQSSALWVLCEGNPPVTGAFHSQKTSNAERIFHVLYKLHFGKLWYLHGWCSALLALCEENQPMTGTFPSQRASNVENYGIVIANALEIPQSCISAIDMILSCVYFAPTYTDTGDGKVSKS